MNDERLLNFYPLIRIVLTERQSDQPKGCAALFWTLPQP